MSSLEISCTFFHSAEQQGWRQHYCCTSPISCALLAALHANNAKLFCMSNLWSWLTRSFFGPLLWFLVHEKFPTLCISSCLFFIVVLLHTWVLSRSRWHKIREVKQTPVTSVVFVLKSQLLRQAEVLRLKKTLWLICGFKMSTNSFKDKKWLFYLWPSHPRMSDDHIVSWLLWYLFLICSDKTVRREGRVY